MQWCASCRGALLLPWKSKTHVQFFMLNSKCIIFNLRKEMPLAAMKCKAELADMLPRSGSVSVIAVKKPIKLKSNFGQLDGAWT